jgi:hypothetical protein
VKSHTQQPLFTIGGDIGNGKKSGQELKRGIVNPDTARFLHDENPFAAVSSVYELHGCTESRGYHRVEGNVWLSEIARADHAHQHQAEVAQKRRAERSRKEVHFYGFW